MSSRLVTLERLTVRRAAVIALVLAVLVSAGPFLSGPFDYALGQLIGSFVMILAVLLGLRWAVRRQGLRGAEEAPTIDE